MGLSTAENVALPEADSMEVTGAAEDGCMKRAERDGIARGATLAAPWDEREEEACWEGTVRAAAGSSPENVVRCDAAEPEWVETGDVEGSRVDCW